MDKIAQTMEDSLKNKKEVRRREAVRLYMTDRENAFQQYPEFQSCLIYHFEKPDKPKKIRPNNVSRLLLEQSVVELFKEGLSYNDISEELKVPLSTIHHYLKKNGLKREQKKIFVNEEYIYNEYKAGKSPHQIAGTSFVPITIVQSIISKRQGPSLTEYKYNNKIIKGRKNYLQYRAMMHKEITKLHTQGKSKEEIKKQLGLRNLPQRLLSKSYLH